MSTCSALYHKTHTDPPRSRELRRVSHNELTRMNIDCSREHKGHLLLLSLSSFLLQHTIHTFYQNITTKRIWFCPASLPKCPSHTIMEFCRAFSRSTKRNARTHDDFSAAARLSKWTVGLKIIGSPGWPRLLSSQNNRKTRHVSSLSGCALRECLYKPSSVDLLLLFQSTITPSREQNNVNLCSCAAPVCSVYQKVETRFPCLSPLPEYQKQDLCLS